MHLPWPIGQSRAERSWEGSPGRGSTPREGPSSPRGKASSSGKTAEATERCSEPSLQGEGRACRGQGHVEVLMQTCLGFP